MAMSRTRKIALILLGILFTLVVVVMLCVALLFIAFRNDEPAIASNSVLILKIKGLCRITCRMIRHGACSAEAMRRR
jgi:hypothetical protein